MEEIIFSLYCVLSWMCWSLPLQFPQMWLVRWLLYFSLIIPHSHNQTVKAANHTKSTQLNPPITELITITIGTITYPEKLVSCFAVFWFCYSLIWSQTKLVLHSVPLLMKIHWHLPWNSQGLTNDNLVTSEDLSQHNQCPTAPRL